MQFCETQTHILSARSIILRATPYAGNQESVGAEAVASRSAVFGAALLALSQECPQQWRVLPMTLFGAGSGSVYMVVYCPGTISAGV